MKETMSLSKFTWCPNLPDLTLSMPRSINSECIAATVKSFMQKSHHYKALPRYLMTTQCFFDTNLTIRDKCERPDAYSFSDTVPVTSSTTGRIYWNRQCAVCNHDTEDLLHWNTTVIFKHEFVFYAHRYLNPVLKATAAEFYKHLISGSEIVFTPPTAAQHKRCVQRKSAQKCGDKPVFLTDAEFQFFSEMCQQRYAPVIRGSPKPTPFYNVFCYLCRGLTRSFSNVSYCTGNSFLQKHKEKPITALLNYRRNIQGESLPDENRDLLDSTNGDCSCNYIYDVYQGSCRPVYCPPGEFVFGCRCRQMIKTVAGVPVLLKLKLTADSGGEFPSTATQDRKFRNKLKKALQASIGHVTVEIAMVFEQNKAGDPYHLFLALFRSEFGYDTKETMKPLLDFLDGETFQQITWNKTKFSVSLMHKLLLLSENASLKAIDLETQLELNPSFIKKDAVIRKSGFPLVFGQELSPLLFCMQVELTGSEFAERNGMLNITNTSLVLSAPDYFLSGPNQARVCVDQYLRSSQTSLGTSDLAVTSLLIVCHGVALTLFSD